MYRGFEMDAIMKAISRKPKINSFICENMLRLFFIFLITILLK